MTEEEEWFGSDPLSMLWFLRGKVSDRKLRLFACAGCRRIWRLIPDGPCRIAVETCERFVDGHADEDELAAAAAEAAQVALAAEQALVWGWNAARTAAMAAQGAQEAAERAASMAAFDVDLVREVMGNPYRCVALDPAWRTPTVMALARAAYHDRAFDRLPILADALEEAGCTDAEVLAHCRGPGPHVRGCWALDLVLDKG
jgi:hypothetical protein